MSIFSRGFIRGYGKIESVMGEPATYTNPKKTTSTAVTVVYVEFAQAIDTFSNALFSLRSATATIERGGFLTYEGKQWNVLDARDSEDGTVEVRASAPSLTS
ncbi:MAG: hypothetical protein E6Q97_10445 [Desulfurellales bacterium]|nr:MAG: hypothetical protein E6Q97_10445 [Desulfurellales bacterium]